MQERASHPTKSPVLVGFCAWLCPGLGYWVLGQRARGVTIGITIFLLFVMGLLIGGIRILDVPGYGPHGERIEMLRDPSGRGAYVLKEQVGEYSSWPSSGWALLGAPFDEIREKPWFIAQVMMGPLNIAAAAGAVRASAPAGEDLGPIGARSHAHVNEIGVLYTAVAGMLNLLAMIDCAHRAAHPAEDEDAANGDAANGDAANEAKSARPVSGGATV